FVAFLVLAPLAVPFCRSGRAALGAARTFSYEIFMNRIHTFLPFLAALCLAAPVALAHVGLPAGGAAAGSSYDATFTVGHACQGAQATTALAVQLPAGFRITEAVPRAGWTL